MAETDQNEAAAFLRGGRVCWSQALRECVVEGAHELVHREVKEQDRDYDPPHVRRDHLDRCVGRVQREVGREAAVRVHLRLEALAEHQPLDLRNVEARDDIGKGRRHGGRRCLRVEGNLEAVVCGDPFHILSDG